MWLLGAAVIVLAIAVLYLAWFSFQLLKQNGRTLARIHALEQQAAQSGTQTAVVNANPASAVPDPSSSSAISQKHPSLAAGDIAPAFTLPDLAGVRHSLNEWLGRPILLVFSSAHCGFCTEMGPDLAAIDYTDPRSLIPIVATNGTAAENAEWADRHHLRFPVLLQEKMEIANLYLASGTPMGYLIDAQGRIASEIAVGSGSLLGLVDDFEKSQPHTTGAGGNGSGAGKSRRAISESRIPRDGLKAGSIAPDFTLPTLDGGEISLARYRGSRVLLVFSDPQCGPCVALDPILEQRHRSRPDLNILMISRGAEDANRDMVAEHGITFPLVLQRQWEISKAYAMFATPIAYLVDENGLIETDIAVGGDAILALLSSYETSTPEEVVAAH